MGTTMPIPDEKTSSELPPTDEFWRNLAKHAWKNVPIPVFGEYEGLIRLNLMYLQTELARLKAKVFASETTTAEQMNLLRQILREYANALRDYEYMRQLPDAPNISQHQMTIMNDFPDLSVLPGAPLGTMYLTFPTALPLPRPEDPVREMLRKYLPNNLSWSKKEMDSRFNDFLQGRLPEVYSPFVDSLARFIMAVGCGASLIVPMIIMSLDPSRNKSLITVSVAVLFFAIFLSSGIGATNTDVLAATATYAAVLVVFVGTSGTTS